MVKLINWKHVTHVDAVSKTTVNIHYLGGSSSEIVLKSEIDLKLFLDDCLEKMKEGNVRRNLN